MGIYPHSKYFPPLVNTINIQFLILKKTLMFGLLVFINLKEALVLLMASIQNSIAPLMWF
jgi:hypothetical protein